MDKTKTQGGRIIFKIVRKLEKIEIDIMEYGKVYILVTLDYFT